MITEPESSFSSTMHILICNERFLFRFGLDRVLILIGRHLRKAGHRITVLANRYDESLDGWAGRVIQIPDSADYLQSNEDAAAFVAANWNDWFPGPDAPDLAIVGGWPFFPAIDLFRAKGVVTLYLDCGAVPTDGYTGGALVIQQKLRALRRQHLPSASHIVSISRFIAESQSIPDSGGAVPVSVVLLGADHLETSIWSSRSANDPRLYLSSQVDRLLKEEKPLLLCLGRWEPNSYKNSEAVFPILDGIAREIPEVRALVLADPGTTEIPRKYRGRVVPVGFPDDAQLQDLMKRVDLGMIHSRWEGFGLPLAEMQWLGRPVLAFADGAHPEVAADPKVLCRNNEEMIQKACQILRNPRAAQLPAEAYGRFREQFRWERVLREWEELIDRIRPARQAPRLIIDVTCASVDPANTGVIRVTRQLSRALQSQARVSFVRWDSENQSYVFPTAEEYRLLQQFNGPAAPSDAVVSPPGRRIRLEEKLDDFRAEHIWLCLPETVRASTVAAVREFARRQRWHVAAVFHDAIPVLHPEFVQDRTLLENHAAYMRELAACDVVIPNSKFSAQCLTDFWSRQEVAGTAVEVDPLAGQFTGQTADLARFADRDLAEPGSQPPDGVARILCVSTIEPRKNHLRLIEACLALKKRRPDLRWQLDLVGNRYAGADDLARKVSAACRAHSEIRWLGVVDDPTLIDLYRRADFTIYPSLIEGFGVPIVESLAFGKPCLCADTGVMAELAVGGGCLTVNVNSSDAIAGGIERLLTDEALRRRLSNEARCRPVRSWDDYAADFLKILSRHASRPLSQPGDPLLAPLAPNPGTSETHNVPAFQEQFDLDEVLYPGCLCERWQMNQSERMAFRALLDQVRPRCAIEVGTYWGGSLSLIAQYAQVVFSIDVDPMPPSVRVFPNVSFLTGPSHVALPALLDALHREELDPQLILIDADHSREGVARDLSIVLERPARCPLWIVMHDSANPDCRAGMLDVDWAANPQVHFVDLDFVPGRIVEHGGGGSGELWGGLALACLLPQQGAKTLQIQQSAKKMMEILSESCAASMPQTAVPLSQPQPLRKVA